MRKLTEDLFTGFAWLAALTVVAAIGVLVGFLVWRGAGTLGWSLFFGETPPGDAVLGRQPVFEGIWPAVAGTLLLVLTASLLALPLGVASGVYLAEFASDRWRGLLSWPVDLLAGVPSIVMGLFGFSVILVLRRTLLPEANTCLFLAAVCLAILVLPYVTRTTQTALESLPEHLRLIGPAVGLSPGQNLRHVLLPSASRAMLSGAILAIGRIAEDTAVILMTGVGLNGLLPQGLFDGFDALPFTIYYLAANYGSQDELDLAFGAALVLLALTGLLFCSAYATQRGLERRWKQRI